MSWPPPAAGAFGVVMTPSAPLTMSPKACVTNGYPPSSASVNSTQPPCDGARSIVCASWPTVPSTTVRSNTVPITWKALQMLGPALSTYMRTSRRA